MAANQDSITDIAQMIGGQMPSYEQQTFLGASIASFSISAGFGTSSSTLGVELVEDEYNGSDGTGQGDGADVYHRGIVNNVAQGDRFIPPTVGAPVYFSFGQKRATIADSYWNVLTDLYRTGGYKNNDAQTYYGSDHFTFGGILQSFTQNKNATGSALYSVQVTDPRDILANTTLILNNYGGTTYNNDNLINIYGFLEHNTKYSDDFVNGGKAMLLGENYSQNGNVVPGLDVVPIGGQAAGLDGISISDVTDIDFGPDKKKFFPVTGTGFSRRSDYGIPWYRVAAAINYLAGWWGPINSEYTSAGFGGAVNFRKLDYVVDFSGLPQMPFGYQLSYDQITLLDLALEICEINSCDLFVSLLPITSHPAFGTLKALNDSRSQNINQNTGQDGDGNSLIGGVIKVQAISRKNADISTANSHKIRNYISATQRAGVPIEARDVGYELTNTTTDKFLVGGQEVNMHYFSTYLDRNKGPANARLPNFDLDTTLKQQMIPYYGMIAKKGVTLPKGFGSFQQIALDTTGLFAAGVGDYYIATEAEMRASLVSYDRWKDFLMQYNDTYCESTEGNDIVEDIQLEKMTSGDVIGGGKFTTSIGSSYEVTSPRCLWPGPERFDEKGLPISPCHPPFGYPLYWKRATQLGIPEGGLVGITSSNTRITEFAAEYKNTNDPEKRKNILNSAITSIQGFGDNPALPDGLRAYYKSLVRKLEEMEDGGDSGEVISILTTAATRASSIVADAPRFAKKGKANAMRVYSFVKKVAEECLGKKFLIKLPRVTNKNYLKNAITQAGARDAIYHSHGPYCFPPMNITQDATAQVSYDDFDSIPQYEMLGKGIPTQFNNQGKKSKNIISVTDDQYYGALDGNWSPVSEEFEFNYIPSQQGGYVSYDLLKNIQANQQSPSIRLGFTPTDPNVFMDDANRLSAYVRFDDAQTLSFDNIGKDNVVQQEQTGAFTVPDISYSYENYSDENGKGINFSPDGVEQKKDGKGVERRVAFVKCDVDPKLFMTFSTSVQQFNVYGEVNATNVYTEPKIHIDPENPCQQAAYVRKRSLRHSPVTTNLGTKSTLHWNTDQLDPNHVWALITLPGRAVPTISKRFNEAMSMKYNADNFRKLLKQDTEILGGGGQYFPRPRGINQTRPNLQGGTVKGEFGDVTTLSADQRILYEKTFKGLTFGCFNRINVTSPSPVYPDLIALPLESKTRCYGPWSSSASAGGKIGGKIEFIKDEDLTPWNYQGWDLMNQAGKLKVDFEESLSLLTERGGFTMAAAPSGLSLATALNNLGPLVSNMNIEVGTNGVKTTIKMDLYTQKFGKMRKQLEDQINKLGRERQKLNDLTNRLTRQGIGKMSSRMNFQSAYETFGGGQGGSYGFDAFDRGGPSASPADTFVKSVRANYNGGGGGFNQRFGNSSTPDFSSEIPMDYDSSDGGMMSSDSLSDAAGILGGNNMLASYYNSASLDIANDFVPISLEPEHGAMIGTAFRSVASQQYLYADGSHMNADGTTESNTVFGG